MVGQPSEEQKRGFGHWWVVILTVLLIMVAIMVGTLFIKNYQQLNDSIQKERISAGSEIGNMVVSKVEMLRDTFFNRIENAANSLVVSGADTSEEVRSLFEMPENYFLIDSTGKMQDLSGNSIIFNGVDLFEQLQLNGVFSTFLTIQFKGEYWLFAKSLDNVLIDGRERIALVMMISSEEYGRVAAVPLYGGLGASYVVDSNGTIMLRPEEDEGDVAFKGYNILSSLERDGVSPEGIEVIRSALSTGESLEISETINGVLWLIQLFPADGIRSIAITIPTSLTAVETFSRMQKSSLYSVIVVLDLVMLVLVWLLYLFRRGQAMKLVKAKAEAKSDFMSKMSHDIRTPLNAIIGMHQLALESAGEQEVVLDCLSKAKVTGEYLVSLINDVLDMSRIESGRMALAHQPFSMEELLTHIYQMESNFAAEKQIDFCVCYDTPVTSDFMGDAVRIRQCLMNLISNSIKFTPIGGRVVLRYEEQDLQEQQRQVVLVVGDSGIGMSEDFMKRIFTPFEQEYSSLTSQYNGSGLGLSIVHNLVTLMGGTITVESVLNQGSTFRIVLTLTVTEKNITQKSSGSGAELPTLLGERILLAEDHQLNRKMASRLMTKLGLIVDEAENGQVALEMFEAAPKGYYTLIFMDINMPIMNGLETARAIRGTNHPDAQNVPIVALSANAYTEDIERSIQAGMNAHLAKPISMEDVKNVMLQMIAGEDRNR